MSVRHCFQRREGFRRGNEKRLRGVEIANGFREISAVNIGNEPEGHSALAVMPECLVSHHWPEIGSANADVDNVANALTGMALPFSTADTVREIGHLIQYGVDLRDYVLTVYDDGCSLGSTQGHVQDSPLFRGVDLLPPKHGVDPRS